VNPGWLAVAVTLGVIVFWTGATYQTVQRLRDDAAALRTELAMVRSERLADDKEHRNTLDRQRDRLRDIEQAMSAYMGRPYIQRHVEDRPTAVRIISAMPTREPVPPTTVG